MPVIPIPTGRLAHATLGELEEWINATPPANADRLLLRASDLIDFAVTTSFAIDEDTGLATDEEECGYAAALRDATCAQVEQWIMSGEVNDIDGMAGQQVTVGGMSVTRPKRIAPRSIQLLNMAGLL